MSADGLSNPHVARYGYDDTYYVPKPSRWPLLSSLAATCLFSGFVLLFNGLPFGAPLSVIGLVAIFACMIGWWMDVAGESEASRYRVWEDISFRWGMGWFIASEVMFFAAFFGALFYARSIAVPDLASETSKVLWPTFQAGWPTKGPYGEVDFTTIGAFGIPALNTLILLTSGATVTWAHWALKMNNRSQLVLGLAVTIALGAIFLGLQAYEYIHAYADLNLKLTSGIYGSTFFMLTGFHGLHVTVGTIGLAVILLRCLLGHFRPDNHFGFEAVAWYWHFVDVVWLALFVIVYWL